MTNARWVLAARVTPRTTPGAGNSDGIVLVRSDAGTTALWRAGGDSRTILCGDTDAVLATSAGWIWLQSVLGLVAWSLQVLGSMMLLRLYELGRLPAD